MAGARARVVSSFTVIKGALVEPTYDLFRHWDLSRPRKWNLDRLKSADPVGAGSANWWRDLAKTVNRRFDTEGRDRVLVELARRGLALETFRPLLLWHMTRDEFLVRDFLSRWLYDQHAAGAFRIRTEDVAPYLDGLHDREDVEIKERWSPSTTSRVASGLLRMAVDFGLMTGTLAREFVPYHLPDDAFLYLLHAAAREEPNPHRLVHAPDWRMYLMGPDDVQRELFRLHQLGRLRYEVAGSVAELRLPRASAEEFAREELSP
ncbi:DUF1819 family protein [Myxococcota bacterium]|nr:DUF1819 family protein [Myxococcota bacterium]